MKDYRPLSERYDLVYVRRRHFADRWTGRLGILGALATAGVMGALAYRGDDRPYTAGPLTAAHDMFARDCRKCHEPRTDEGLGGLLMPASDSLCLKCHSSQATIHADNQAALFAGGMMPGHPDIRLSSNCAACHVEHRGRHANLSDVPDSFCIRCHEDLKSKGMSPSGTKPPMPPTDEPVPATGGEPHDREGGSR